ncbi:MAG: alcohol dehydrogenase catalytic domain-containing protein, partial [Anaerolineales bacterium]|nr:alcohol dehydrogenase catalytic domain-containing protein [Anaerolineales bacterium]
MYAVHLTNNTLTLQTDYPKPVPAANEALIRVRLMGICSTDLEIVQGYVPGFSGVLGHEFVGEVVECTAVPSWQGRRVT